MYYAQVRAPASPRTTVQQPSPYATPLVSNWLCERIQESSRPDWIRSSQRVASYFDREDPAVQPSPFTIVQPASPRTAVQQPSPYATAQQAASAISSGSGHFEYSSKPKRRTKANKLV